jgi:probable phosphoglycerate mutase
MTRIYLIRHAEAEGNLYRRIHGRYDSALTPRGERQLAALRQRFDHIALDAVYTSPLQRAYRTALAVCGNKNLAPIPEPGLLEIDMGPWEDLPFGEAAQREPERLKLFRTADPTYDLPGGENYQALFQRLRSALLRLAEANPDKTIACVSHSMAIRSALCWCHGWGVERLREVPRTDNTGVSLIKIEGEQVHISFEADSSHLPEELSTLKKQTWWQGAKTLADANLWFRNWDPVGERQLYLQFRQEAWHKVHGHEPFDGESFYAVALRAARYAPRSVRVVLYGNTIAGLIQLDLEREAEEKVGFIPFCYLCPPYRGHGLGTQLLGEAISICRPLGRDKLRLRCSPVNEYAKRFYQANGFYYIGPATDSKVALDLLEKRLTRAGQ